MQKNRNAQKESCMKTALYYAQIPSSQHPLYKDKMLQLYKEMENLPFKYTYCIHPLIKKDEGYKIQDTSIVLKGNLVNKMLENSHSVILIGCTLGHDFDKKLRKCQLTDMGDAWLLDALASAYIDAKLDEVQYDLQQKLKPGFLTERFSCGYSDLDLALQPKIVKEIQKKRNIGISCLPSLLMVPMKSITALIGIADVPQKCRLKGCNTCTNNESCPYKHP